MKPSLYRFGVALCRILGVLALVGQMAVAAATPPAAAAAGTEIQALTAIGAYCHGGSRQAGDKDGQPCHCHDLSPCMPAGSLETPQALPAASPEFLQPPRISSVRHGMPPASRAPPRRWVQSNTPRGPPAIPA